MHALGIGGFVELNTAPVGALLYSVSPSAVLYRVPRLPGGKQGFGSADFRSGIESRESEFPTPKGK